MPTKHPRPRRCTWVQDGPEQDDIAGNMLSQWDTSCGHFFMLTNGGPKRQGFKHCPFCGKPLAESILP